MDWFGIMYNFSRGKPSSGSNLQHLVLLSAAVLFLHTATSYLEELLFKTLRYTYASFMILFMCVLYVLLYLSIVSALGQRRCKYRIVLTFDRIHYLDIGAVCLLYVGSNTISKTALNYVSIPLQMVFKTCKLVAVMLSSGIILGKRYTLREYIVAGCFVSGMALFTYGDWLASGGASRMDQPLGQLDLMLLTGIMWLCLALTCDSALGNLQEKVQKAGTIGGEIELMYLQSVVGGAALFILTAGQSGKTRAPTALAGLFALPQLSCSRAPCNAASL